jgi:hypothetical protein
MSESIMEQCGGCRFWLNWDSEMTNLGECHRYPPRMATVHRVDAGEALTRTLRPEGGGWPLTAPDDWCGEFLPRQGRATESPPPSAAKEPDVGPGGI